MDIIFPCGDLGWDGCKHSNFDFFCRERKFLRGCISFSFWLLFMFVP